MRGRLSRSVSGSGRRGLAEGGWSWRQVRVELEAGASGQWCTRGRGCRAGRAQTSRAGTGQGRHEGQQGKARVTKGSGRHETLTLPLPSRDGRLLAER